MLITLGEKKNKHYLCEDMKRIAAKLIIALIAAFSLVSGCQCNRIDPERTGYDRVLILYSAGFNSLSGYLREDIMDLKSGYVPDKKSAPKEGRLPLISACRLTGIKNISVSKNHLPSPR